MASYSNGGGKGLSFPQKLSIGLVILGILIVIVFSGKIFQNVDANQIVCTQDPLDGDLHWHITAGLKNQNLGKVTDYIKSSQYWFSKQKD